jgi:predicted nucleic acid-binding protein
MSAKTFVDTNILIYAYDLDAGIKHDRAKACLQQLWNTCSGMLSTQVMQEFYVNATRKIAQPLSPARARNVLCTYLAWPIEVTAPETILFASELQELHRLSFWDAMIIATATQGNAEILLTEDLNHGQIIERVRVHNPFLIN